MQNKIDISKILKLPPLKRYTEIISTLQQYNEIIFGPNTGELGWEIMRFTGFIRWFKKQFPDKKVYISTRKNRIDLYYDIADGIHAFDIKGDYEKYSLRIYGMIGKNKEHQNEIPILTNQLIDKAFEIFPNATMFTFSDNPKSTNVCEIFSMGPQFSNYMDYDIVPRYENKGLLNDVLSSYKKKIKKYL